MKKILFATTALVATAGVAAAEVAVSGSAEIGVIDGTRYEFAPTDNGAEFWTDIEVVFTMTGEADNGLTFGAKIDLDEAANANGRDDGGATWFLAFGGARLDMGDTDGALDWAMKETNVAGGSIDDSETWQPGFNGNASFDGQEDGQVARFTYTFDAFAVALSAEVDDTPKANATDDGPTIWGIGFRYSGDLGGINLGVGLGYQQQDNRGDIVGVSVDGALDNGLSFALNYSEFTPDNTFKTATFTDTATHWGIGFGYTMNALTVGLNYGEYDNAIGLDGTWQAFNNNSSSHGYGLVVNYDFGGGLVGQFGAGMGEQKVGNVTTDRDSFSLGLAMSF